MRTEHEVNEVLGQVETLETQCNELQNQIKLTRRQFLDIEGANPTIKLNRAKLQKLRQENATFVDREKQLDVIRKSSKSVARNILKNNDVVRCVLKSYEEGEDVIKMELRAANVRDKIKTMRQELDSKEHDRAILDAEIHGAIEKLDHDLSEEHERAKHHQNEVQRKLSNMLTKLRKDNENKLLALSIGHTLKVLEELKEIQYEYLESNTELEQLVVDHDIVENELIHHYFDMDEAGERARQYVASKLSLDLVSSKHGSSVSSMESATDMEEKQSTTMRKVRSEFESLQVALMLYKALSGSDFDITERENQQKEHEISAHEEKERQMIERVTTQIEHTTSKLLEKNERKFEAIKRDLSEEQQQRAQVIQQEIEQSYKQEMEPILQSKQLMLQQKERELSGIRLQMQENEDNLSKQIIEFNLNRREQTENEKNAQEESMETQRKNEMGKHELTKFRNEMWNIANACRVPDEEINQFFSQCLEILNGGDFGLTEQEDADLNHFAHILSHAVHQV